MALISNIGLPTAEALTGEPNEKDPTFNKETLTDNYEVEKILIGYYVFMIKKWSTTGDFLEREENIRG